MNKLSKEKKKKESEKTGQIEQTVEFTASIPLGGFPEDIDFVEVRCPKCGYTTEVFEYDPDHPPLCPKDKTPLKPI